MTLAKALQVAAGNSQESADVAEAIDCDGTNDYLYRTSDLTGNADGKTFTFSAWVWMDPTSSDNAIYSLGTTGGGYIRFTASTGVLSINLQNTAGSALVLNVTGTAAACPFYTWTNLLISVDLASTANRRVYVNDQLVTVTWTTYTNAAINWTQTAHYVASQYGSAKSKARLSNVFLDYTYRDLTVEANRRLFVTADLKPAAGQAALNPILYLPMNDPTQPGLNQGTGGSFTLTGVVARSGRGPNQYNAPYSDLDGAADYLSRTTAPTGIADGKQFTVSFVINTAANSSNDHTVMKFGSLTSERLRVAVWDTAVGPRIELVAANSSGSSILSTTWNFPSTTRVNGRNYQVVASIDLSDTSKRFVYVNGVAATLATASTYVNADIQFNITSTPRYRIGANIATTPGEYVNGKLGALWFNTSYIDLSVAANLAKFVTGTGINAAPVDLGATGELPTGTAPIIYLPMYGNNAGKNYGTGGDFTVNSGPYTGARGPNEFWGNWCGEENGSVGYLSRTGVSGINTGKTFSLRARMQTRVGVTSTRTILSQQSPNFFIEVNANDALVITARNSAGTVILSATSANSAITPGTLYDLAINIDLSSTSNRRVSLNGGQDDLSMTWTTYTNDTLGLNTSTLTRLFCRATDTSSLFYGKLGEFYFTTDYIDFSQEVNRLKFRDAFGNPVDLTQQIQAGAIPNPAIYMRFPPGSFGTNSGTGGAFTQSGNMYDGGQL